jgi:hypothetical protein
MLLRPRIHALAGVYAIDALESPAERQTFERHLERCESCADEVRGLTETATMLGMAAARRPPATLRPRVMTAVATASQLPGIRQHARPRPRGWRATGLAATVAVVAAAAAIVLAVALTKTQQRLDTVRVQDQAIAAVLAARDARIMSAATSAGGRATVVVSPGRRQMVVSTAGLRPLPAGRVYQLWLIGPPHTRSAGLLPAGVAGRRGPLLASGVAPGDKFGMTVEPSGGTAQPTTKPIVLLTLPG